MWNENKNSFVKNQPKSSKVVKPCLVNRNFWQMLLTSMLLFSSIFAEVTAETELKTFSVFMDRQIINQGNIPYTGAWGPVRDAHLVKISVPARVGDFRVSFVKRGFTTADCGNSSRVVTIADGGATTADHIKQIYGSSRVSAHTNRIGFVACASVSPHQDINRFFIKIHYEKELPDKKEPKPDTSPPPVKTSTFKQMNHARLYSVTCTQLSANRGCSYQFKCPDEYALTNVRATCDLENGKIRPLPKQWGVVNVARKSDKTSSGSCRLGDIKISKDSQSITHLTTSDMPFYLGCSEYDKNGGDCSINSQLLCQKIVPNVERVIPFDCTVKGNNSGCSKSVSCPSGYVALDARASCNLETGKKEQLPDWGWLEVQRATDKKSKNNSRCSINETHLTILKKPIYTANAKKLLIACKEHDKNGGDCNINGELKCAKLVPPRKR